MKFIIFDVFSLLSFHCSNWNLFMIYLSSGFRFIELKNHLSACVVLFALCSLTRLSYFHVLKPEFGHIMSYHDSFSHFNLFCVFIWIFLFKLILEPKKFWCLCFALFLETILNLFCHFYYLMLFLVVFVSCYWSICLSICSQIFWEVPLVYLKCGSHFVEKYHKSHTWILHNEKKDK